LAADEQPPVPAVETVALGPLPDPEPARPIVWGGATARRADVQRREATERIPVLAYHRIVGEDRQTPEAFAEQMRWLRRQGYHPVTSGDVLHHLAAGQRLAGRPVLITFDDAYGEFHDVVWPILRAHDFMAEVFVATDCVGGHADWDGLPAPLMSWPQIQ